MIDNKIDNIINITDPKPILKQIKSSLTTNPFIPNEQKIIELEEVEYSSNKIIEDQMIKNKKIHIFNQSLTDINKNISKSVIGFFDDLFLKQKNTPIHIHLQTILKKDERYTYIGILFIVIAIYIMFVTN